MPTGNNEYTGGTWSDTGSMVWDTGIPVSVVHDSIELPDTTIEPDLWDTLPPTVAWTSLCSTDFHPIPDDALTVGEWLVLTNVVDDADEVLKSLTIGNLYCVKDVQPMDACSDTSRVRYTVEGRNGDIDLYESEVKRPENLTEMLLT